jgi:hypothetical protein
MAAAAGCGAAMEAGATVRRVRAMPATATPVYTKLLSMIRAPSFFFPPNV